MNKRIERRNNRNKFTIAAYIKSIKEFNKIFFESFMKHAIDYSGIKRPSIYKLPKGVLPIFDPDAQYVQNGGKEMNDNILEQFYSLELAFRVDPLQNGAVPIYDADTEVYADFNGALVCADDNGLIQNISGERIFIPIIQVSKKHIGIYSLLKEAAKKSKQIKRIGPSQVLKELIRFGTSRKSYNIFINPLTSWLDQPNYSNIKFHTDYRVSPDEFIVCEEPDAVGVLPIYSTGIFGACVFNCKAVTVFDTTAPSFCGRKK